MLGHTDVVETASFSSDGMRLVTASRDGPVQVWDVASGHLLLSLEGHTAPVVSASFSPDGTRLVTVSRDTTAKVWDVASGHLLLSLEDHTGWVLSASFSPDGTRLVTASADKTAKVWNVALETRSPAEVAALVRCRGLWRLNAEGQLLQAAPDLMACPPLAAAR
jgi:WD40 repeat protein